VRPEQDIHPGLNRPPRHLPGRVQDGLWRPFSPFLWVFRTVAGDEVGFPPHPVRDLEPQAQTHRFAHRAAPDSHKGGEA
jgi:hypothetical protein